LRKRKYLIERMHKIGTMSANLYPTERMIIESVATIICFVLARFMVKPYKLTREGSYLGLPLGFAFLGISYALAALAYSPLGFGPELMWLPLLTRTFAFVFLATTYLFSSRKSKSSQILGEITISLLIIALASSFILAFVAPQFAFAGYLQANVYLRIFNVICLAYIAICTLRSYVKNPDRTTIWIPFGFIFLAISQYSLLFWYIDSSFSAFVGSLIARFIGLGIFLFVAIRTFYVQDKEGG
jgi:hypothetical protein